MSSKIIMTTSVTRLCFATQHKTCKTKTKTTVCKTKTKTDFFWSQTGLVLRPTVSDHITAIKSHYIKILHTSSPLHLVANLESFIQHLLN